MLENYGTERPVSLALDLIRCHQSGLTCTAQEDKELNLRMMAQLLGLEFPGIDSQISSQTMPPGLSTSKEGYNNYTSSSSDGLSDSSLSPEMQHWMQNYPESAIPVYGYDFQSFT